MGTPSRSAPRVFVSYSHKDSDFTQRLVNDLHSAGAKIWVDVEGITHGNFMQRIDEALEQCEWLVLVLTPNAVASQFVKDEVNAARLREHQGYMHGVIPVLAAPCDPKTIPPQWATLHRYDATRDYDACLAGLLKALGLTANETKGSATDSPTPSPQINADEAEDAGGMSQVPESDPESTRFFAEALEVHKMLDFFDERLSKAFPGVRGVKAYSGRDAVSRLQRLLAEPLSFRFGDSILDPIWWWRGHSNMYIDRFKVLDEASLRCLLGTQELLVDTIAVYRAPRPYWSFVYVVARADKPTGVTLISKEDIERQVREDGEAYEDVGYWNGRYVSRAEFDDGYAEIDGEMKRLEGAEPRLRHLSDYNIFIASNISVLNNGAVDETMEQACEELLAGSMPLADVARLVRSMKLKERIAEYYFALE